jgi:transposase
MSKAIEITRHDYTAFELRGIAAQSDEGAVVRRLLAVAFVLDGKSRAEAAQACGMDRQTLRDWIIRFNESGIPGLANRAVPGRPPALSAADMAQVRQIVLAGPDPDKHGVVRWRCVDLQSEIEARFGVRFHETTIGRLLGKLNLTRLQPRPAHPGKSADAEATFKKTFAKPSARRRTNVPQAKSSRSGSRMKPAWASRAP